MRKLVILAASVMMAATVAPAAYAAPVITMSAPASDGSFSGSFSDSGIAAGAFTDIFTFTVPSMGTAGATISSIFVSSTQNNVNFSSVSLDGTPFAILSTGNVEFRDLVSLGVLAGTQTLSVMGNSGGNASFAGTIAFAPTAAVPEPAAWLMMMLGMGAVGFAMRRRQQVRTTVPYAI